MKIYTDSFETVARNVRMGGVKSLDYKFVLRFFRFMYVFEL